MKAYFRILPKPLKLVTIAILGSGFSLLTPTEGEVDSEDQNRSDDRLLRKRLPHVLKVVLWGLVSTSKV